jgi:translocator protein
MKRFLVFLGAVLLVQFLGNLLTMSSVGSWYPTLQKSTLTPPGYVFGVVWTILYLLMAVAAFRVSRREGRFWSPALRLWWAQLFLGLLWSAVFFGLREPVLALAVIVAVWAAAVATLARFLCAERIAGYLLLPLGLWVSFASYLNLVIVLKN